MTAARKGWTGSVRELGLAAGDLVRAEISALASDLGASGRALVSALLVAAVGGAVAFWALGLLVDLAIELLALVLPRWGAVAVVFGVFAVTAALLLLWARARLRRIEAPDATVRRRLADSRRWWAERVAPEREVLADDRLDSEEPS